MVRLARHWHLIKEHAPILPPKVLVLSSLATQFTTVKHNRRCPATNNTRRYRGAGVAMIQEDLGLQYNFYNFVLAGVDIVMKAAAMIPKFSLFSSRTRLLNCFNI